jgi:hypothetical protein
MVTVATIRRMHMSTSASPQSGASNLRGWRWRRCPACHAVERASDFAALDFGPAWTDGGSRRRCPHCGHVAATRRFTVVRERHP